MKLRRFIDYWIVKFRKIYRLPQVKYTVLGLIGVLVFLIPTLRLSTGPVLKEGEISPFDIVSPVDITVIDEVATQRYKLELIRSMKKVYKRDTEAEDRMFLKLQDYLNRLEALGNASQALDRSADTKLNKLFDELELSPLAREELLRLLAEPDRSDWLLFKLEVIDALGFLLKYQWRLEDIYTERGREQIRSLLNLKLKDIHSVGLRETAEKLVMHVLEPNVKLDVASTKARLEKLLKRLRPVKLHIRKGQIIVHKGEIVTATQESILRKLGLVKESFPMQLMRKLGVALVVTLLVLVFLQQFSKTSNREELLLLIYGIIFTELVFARLVESSSKLLAPTAMPSLLISLLVGPLEGTIIGFITAIYHGLLFQKVSSILLILLTLEAVGGAILSRTVVRHLDILRIALMLMGYMLLANVSFWVFAGRAIDVELLWSSAYLLGGVTLSIVLAMGMLMFLESRLSFTSPLKLVSLLNPLHPLLQRLYSEAPGTYSHSVMVAHLAEQAAKAINADSLLCRVGAYYHDVGKLKRPQYFVENQFSSHNPHDELDNPRLSAIYIIAHVRDGVKLAEEYGLPKTVIDFIRTHHGTSLVSYFYYKAKKQGMTVSESEFRYSGPKPFSKETAIVMLADSLEAAARALDKHDLKSLKELVETTVKLKVEDGQLQDAPITLAELEAVKEAFLRTLISTYHRRIKYPKPS